MQNEATTVHHGGQADNEEQIAEQNRQRIAAALAVLAQPPSSDHARSAIAELGGRVSFYTTGIYRVYVPKGLVEHVRVHKKPLEKIFGVQRVSVCLAHQACN